MTTTHRRLHIILAASHSKGQRKETKRSDGRDSEDHKYAIPAIFNFKTVVSISGQPIQNLHLMITEQRL